MELILVLSGLAFISASFILARRQQRDYLRIQEKLMESVVDAGVVELQMLATDLGNQLSTEARVLVDQLEEKVRSLEQSIELTQPGGANTPPAIIAEPEKPQAALKPGSAIGGWGERERLVREMHSHGMETDVIAKELNIGKGEVKLILDLHREEAR